MFTSRRKFIFAIIAALLLPSAAVCADPARFDLAGPKVEVRVTREGVTLPIAQVPNLKAGDKIWLHPDFPPSQSVKYLLVAAFLRGTTNPPTDSWFTRIETWNRKVQSEGVFITVPPEAQQVILFLAPETGGDFSTLRSAVKGRPGVFVRASQDLNEAGFEQARIEKYLDGMKTADPTDPKALSEHSTLLARTLALRPNDNCFKQPVEAQYNCLTQSGSQLLLDDGHGQTIASSLSNGPSSDFINAASSTTMAGGGAYSAYVGAIVDLVRLTSTLHTAQYQYIPAIAFPSDQQLNLRLNAPPSFHNPKSVIVIGLPAVQAATPPPLRAADPKQVACLLRPDLVLGLEGAPLVFSTGFAHGLALHINSPNHVADVPLAPDPFRGGLIVAQKPHREILPVSTPEADIKSASGIVTGPVKRTGDDANAVTGPATPSDTSDKPTVGGLPGPLSGTVTGMWGFDHFTGPTLPLQNAPGKGWKLVTTDPLIVGQDNHLVLASSGTACVEAVLSDSVPGTETRLDWKLAEKPDQISLNLPLKSLSTDTVRLAIKQYGTSALDAVSAKTYSEPAKLDALNLHAGDMNAVLYGSSLDQVKQLEVKGLIFTPSGNQDASPAVDSKNNLSLSLDATTSDPKSPDTKVGTPKLSSGDKLTAMATLKDGRTLTLAFTVGGARPTISLLSKGIDQPGGSTIRLSPNELPINEKLTFFLKSSEDYPRGQQIEIANADASLHTKLSIADRTLILQNKHTVLATLEPLKLFGPSAFGPLRVRAVAPDGTTGAWIPLTTVVRLPTLTDLHCPARARQQPCTLEGSDLYLVDAFSSDPTFALPTQIPEGFVGNSVTIPRPAETTFYVRLRDDPSTINEVTLPVQPTPSSTQPSPASTALPAQPAASTIATPPTK